MADLPMILKAMARLEARLVEMGRMGGDAIEGLSLDLHLDGSGWIMADIRKFSDKPVTTQDERDMLTLLERVFANREQWHGFDSLDTLETYLRESGVWP